MSHVRLFLASFQTRLVLSLTAVILLAIFLAGTIFVIRTRDERRQQALDRVAAASPAIYQQTLLTLLRESQEGHHDNEDFVEILGEMSHDQHVRILLVNGSGTVLHDTGGRLGGQTVQVPPSTRADIARGFVSWEPGSGFPERDITLVSASSRYVTPAGRELPFNIVLVVETGTLASAWVGVLPGLGIASLIAVPIAILAGLVLARQVAGPVRRLTVATQAMAQGDLSQRVEAERDDELGQLARSFTAMSQRVGERDQQMRALLANVSHDLKTPMTSITGYAQALTDGTADPTDVERVGRVIRAEAEHVNALLADLLYLGEIEAGQVVTRHEDVPLSDVAERCLQRLDPRVQEKHLDITRDVGSDAVLQGADPEKVERALTNVLDNAVKFTPAGGSVFVRGWRNNGYVRCAVTNSGSRITEDDLPRVFERFFRGDRARRTSAGSGLGLAITRQLVELQGGRVEASSDDGGVTVTLTFPA